MIDYLEELLREQERDEDEALGIVLPAEDRRFRRRRALPEEAPRRAEERETFPSDPEWGDALALSGFQAAEGALRRGDPPLPEISPGTARTAAETQSQLAGTVPELEEGVWRTSIFQAGETEPPVRGRSSGGELERAPETSLPVWLETAGRPGGADAGGGAAWLYQRLRATAAAAYPGRAGQTVTLVKEAGPAAQALSPTELDRALERDARRYDGGFTLF